MFLRVRYIASVIIMSAYGVRLGISGNAPPTLGFWVGGGDNATVHPRQVANNISYHEDVMPVMVVR